MERQQELRVAICARNMVESGNWIVPRFQEQVRLRKPPLNYWLVASLQKATGQTASPFWARIPGLLAGISLVLLVYVITSRLFSTTAGLWAGLCMALNYGFIRHARLAETDTTLTLFTTLAIFFVYLAFQGNRRFWWPLAGIAMGLGFLAKGPAALAMPMLAMFFYAVGVEEGRKNFSWVGLLLMLICAAVIAAPWYYTIHLFTQSLPDDGGQISQELQDTFAKTKHPGTIFYYIYTLPRMLLPGGLLLPFATVAFFKKGAVYAERSFVAGWFVSSFLLLSVIASKQSHYAVLLLPVASILVGRWLAELRTAPVPRTLTLIAVVGALLTSIYAYGIYPRTEGLSKTPEFLSSLKKETHDARMIHVVGINSAVFDFYLGRHVHNIDHLGQAYQRAKPGDAIVAIKKHDTFVKGEIPTARAKRDEQTSEYRYLFYLKQ